MKTLQYPWLLYALCLTFGCVFILDQRRRVLEIILFRNSTIDLSLALIFDRISLRFATIVSFIAANVFMFAHTYIHDDPNKTRFLYILTLFVFRIIVLIFSGSLFLILLGWDGLGITSFALIIYYQRKECNHAGFLTLLVNRLGDSIIVVSTVFFIRGGSLVFYNPVIFGLILILRVAALTKRAQYPFRPWLPAAMAAPTPVRALVHSSTLVTAGVYLVIRLSHSTGIDEATKRILLLLGSVTCLLGGWAASAENDLKKVIALSTLRQLGVIMFSLGLGLPYLALFHLYTHALFKSLLFLAAGRILINCYGQQDIRVIGGVGLSTPITTVIFNIRSLCLIGGPFIRSYYSKHTILEIRTCTSLNLFAFVIILLATFFTAKYVIRILKRISWGKPMLPILFRWRSIYLTLPILFLGMGSILAGKFYVSISPKVVERTLISNFFAFFINIITVLGLVWGWACKPYRSKWLSTLFYLTPSYSVNLQVTKGLNSLDYGWLEYNSSLLKFSGANLTYYWGWPNQLSLTKLVLASLLLL